MNAGKDIYFYSGVLLFALGIAGSFLLGLWTTIIGLVVLVGMGIVVGGYHRGRTVPVMTVVQLVLVGLCGALLAASHQAKHISHPLDSRVGQQFELVGVVVAEPDVRDFNTRLTVELDNMNVRVLIKTPFYPEYNYGDRIRINGTLALPQGFVGDTNRFFDYKNYLLKDNIRYLVNYPTVELIATDQGHPVKSFLFVIKHTFLGQLQTMIGEPHVSLLGGLLLGAKSAMGSDLLDDFRDTGVIHIVVLSGFNITVIVWFVMAMLGFLGQRTAAVIGSVTILCFAIMTGAGSTVVRASLMAFLVIVAKLTGNYAAVMRMLCVAGVMMLVWNPMLLLYDPSFQLSFTATVGLVLLTPYIERYYLWLPNWKIAELRSLVAATISTQIMVTPLLLYMMGTFPTYSLVTNFLILATVPWVMLTGFLCGVVGFLSYTAALPLITVTYLLLAYELWVVDIFAHLPFAAFTVPPFGFEWVVGVYVLYAAIAWYYKKTRA